MELATWTFLAFALALTVDGSITVEVTNEQQYSFGVDYENNQFLLDGQPFRYVSGSFHYFRAPRIYWRDRLTKMKAAGLNAVCTYVEWSLHQPKPDQWHWSGDADLEYFITLAQELDLLVILRPGPYICAERDLGGLPTWLLGLVPDIRLRTSDSRYMTYVATYLKELMDRVEPFLRGNGGPVIMLQVENEYGSFNACDLSYMSQLRDLLSQRVGNKALLFTTDGTAIKMLRCGTVPEVYATIDFGVSTNATQAFSTMRLFQPKGPFVNSEFYPGWLSHWEETFQTVSTRSIVRKLDEMLALGASVNIYVFYGGTNFGFTSGANTDPRFRPQQTSYDYDAPITEAGDLTPKYYAIRSVIGKYLPIPNITLPEPSAKGDYGLVLMEPLIRLFDPYMRVTTGIEKLLQDTPPSFESFIGTPVAFVLYETDIPSDIPKGNHSDPNVLRTGFLHDRALVYEDDHFVGILSRTHGIKTISLPNPYGSRLKILVENEGHVNFGNMIHDLKGVGNVTLNGVPLSNKWNATGFRLPDVHLHKLKNLTSGDMSTDLDHGPLLLYATFEVNGVPLDTFLDTTGWGKGVAFVNGNNLGRYWPVVGSQITLYVPASFLLNGTNYLHVLELEYVPKTRKLRFQTVPNLRGP